MIPYLVKLFSLADIHHCIIETVGSGQLDVMIEGVADTTVLVLSPDSGDGVQMMKAGILEIADLIVVNKSDRSGINQIMNQLRAWLEFLPSSTPWVPPLITAQANKHIGIEELFCQSHRTPQVYRKHE